MNKDELAKKAWEENGKFWTHIGYFVAGYEAKESMERELYEGLKRIISDIDKWYWASTYDSTENAKQLIKKYEGSQK